MPHRRHRARHRQRRRATTWCSSAPRPAATASAAPACSPARSSTRRSRRSARASRSATRSPRRSSSRPASSCMHRKLVVSMQDLGAAGLTSSSSEMASKGFVGLDIHADRVPLREADMEPWEIMISESQERMLAIVTEERARRRARGLRALGPRLHRHRRGHRQQDAAHPLARRARGRHPGPAARGREPGHPHALRQAGLPGRRPGRRRRPVVPAAGRTSARRSRSSSPRPTSPASAGPGSSTTTSSRPTPCRSPAATPPCCASRTRSAASPSATTATAATATSIPIEVPRRPSPRRRAT